MSNAGFMGIPFQLTFDVSQAVGALQSVVSTVTGSFANIQNIAKNSINSLAPDVVALYDGITSVSGAMNYMVKGLKNFEAFEKLIIKTGGLLNATKSELVLLADTAMQLGAETEHKATDVATAMSQMALAGFSVNEIIGAMPGLLGMATAGMINVAQATTISSEILRTFQIEAKNMDYISGALTTTFTTTNTTLQTLSYTMKYVGAQATELGVGLSQVAAVAGVLGNLGIKGSMSGTGLRQFIEKLSAGLGGMSQKLQAGAKGLQSLGITWKDISDEAGNLDLVLAVEKIGASLDRMGAKASQRLKILRDIFGTRASSQVSAMISGGHEVLAAKDIEVAYGGAKQQLMGFLQQATKLPEGMHGIKINAQEMATSFVTVGAEGRRNFERLGDQMRQLGLVGGMFNTQLGITRERVQKVDGKLIRDTTFVPLQELTEGSLRAVDGLTRLRRHLSTLGSEAQLKILQELFGADPKMLERATKAFTEGGKAMTDFANRMLAANSAMDIQKRIMDSTWGSLELLEGSFDTFKMALGEIISPIVRIVALVGASAVDLLMAGNTVEAKFAELQTNIGGLEKFVTKFIDSFNKLSILGKVVAGWIMLIGASLMTLAAALTVILPIITTIIAVLTALATVFVVLPAIIGGLVWGVLDILLGSIVKLGAALATAYASGGAGLLPMLLSFAQALLPIVAGVVKWAIGAILLYYGMGLVVGVIRSVVSATVTWISQWAHMAYVLFPLFLESLRQIYDSIANIGSVSLSPNISLTKMRAALPEEGVKAAVINLKSTIKESMAEVDQYIKKGAQVATQAMANISLIMAQAITAVALDAIENLGEEIGAIATTIATEIVGNLVRVADYASFMSNIVVNTMIQGAFLALEGMFWAMAAAIKGAFGVIYVAARTFIFDLPAIFLNGFLQLNAFAIRSLGNLLVGSITIFGKLVNVVIDSSIVIMSTIAKVMLVIMTLPVSLPYIAARASIAFIRAFLEKMQPGFDSIRTVLVELFENLKNVIMKLVQDIIASVFLPIKAVIMSMVSIVSTVVTTLVNLPSVIYGVVGRLVDIVLDSLDSIIESIYGFMTTLPSRIRQMIIEFFGVISNAFVYIIRAITSFGVSLAETISRILATIGRVIVGVVVGIPYMILRVTWAIISGTVIGILNFIQRAFTNLRHGFLSIAGEFIYSGIGRFFTNLVAFFTEGIPNMIQAVRNEIADAYLRIMSAVRYVMYTIPQSIIGILQFIVDDVLIFLIELPSKAADYFIDAIETATDFIINTVDAILKFGVNQVGENTVAGIESLIERTINLIIDFPAAFLEEIDYQMDRVATKFQEAIAKLESIDWENVGLAIVRIIQSVFDRMVKAWNSVMNMFTGEAGSGFITLGFRLVSAIYTMFSTIIANFPWDRLRSLFASIVNSFINFVIQIGDAVMNAFGRLIRFLSGGTLIEAFRNAVVWFLNLQYSIVGWVGKAKDFVKAVFPDAGAAGVIRNVLLGLLNLVEAGAKLAMGLMKPVFDWLETVFVEVQAIIDMFSGIWDVFDSLNAGLFDVLSDPALFKILTDAIIAALDRLATLIPAPFRNFANAIFGLLGAPLAVGGYAINGIVTILSNAVLTIVKVFGVLAEAFRELTDKLLASTGGIVNWFNNLLSKMMGAGTIGGMAAIFVGEIWDVFKTYSGSAIDWFKGVFDKMKNELAGAGPIGKAIADSMDWIGGVAYIKFKDALAWITSAGDPAIADLQFVLNNLETFIKAIGATMDSMGLITVSDTTKNATGVKDMQEFIRDRFAKYFTDPLKQAFENLEKTLSLSAWIADVKKAAQDAYDDFKMEARLALYKAANEAKKMIGEVVGDTMKGALLYAADKMPLGIMKTAMQATLGLAGIKAKNADQLDYLENATKSLPTGKNGLEGQIAIVKEMMDRMASYGIDVSTLSQKDVTDLLLEVNKSKMDEAFKKFASDPAQLAMSKDKAFDPILREIAKKKNAEQQAKAKADEEAVNEELRKRGLLPPVPASVPVPVAAPANNGVTINVNATTNNDSNTIANGISSGVQYLEQFLRLTGIIPNTGTPSTKPAPGGIGTNPDKTPMRQNVPSKR
jgi:TP901 family phage tail tape measure protein